MKRSILLIISLFLLYSSFAQVTTREIAEEKIVTKPVIYDSLMPFKGNVDLRIYINQDIFIIPRKIYYGLFTPSPIHGGNSKEWLYMPIIMDIPHLSLCIFKLMRNNSD